MIYEHLTKSGDQKTASIINGTTASPPFSSLSKNASSGQAHHSLTVENLLNYGTKKSAVATTTNHSVPKMEAFEVKPEVKYSTLALNGNPSLQSTSIISESFIKKTLLDAEVKKEQPSKGSFTQLKEDYKSLIEGHVETLKHRMTGTIY